MSQIAGKGNEADRSSKNLCEEHRQVTGCSIQLNDWVAQRKVTAQKNSRLEKRLVPRLRVLGWRSPSSWKLNFLVPVSAATEAHGLSHPGQGNCVHGLKESCRDKYHTAQLTPKCLQTHVTVDITDPGHFTSREIEPRRQCDTTKV